MSTENNDIKVKATAFTSATLRYDNSSDEDRKFDIFSSADFKAESLQSVTDGNIQTRQGEAVARFYQVSGQLNITFYTPDKEVRREAMDAAEDFIFGISLSGAQLLHIESL